MHKFRDNAVTGDIPLISLVLTSMVPLSTFYLDARDFWDILRHAAQPFVLLPAFAGLLLEPVRANSVASGLNAYNLQTTLIQYDSIYTLKYGPGLGKTLFPVLGDNRTLRMRQPDH